MKFSLGSSKVEALGDTDTRSPSRSATFSSKWAGPLWVSASSSRKGPRVWLFLSEGPRPGTGRGCLPLRPSGAGSPPGRVAGMLPPSQRPAISKK